MGAEGEWHYIGVKQAILVTGLYRPCQFQEVKAQRLHDNWHMRVVGLSALHNGCLYSPGNISGTHFC